MKSKPRSRTRQAMLLMLVALAISINGCGRGSSTPPAQTVAASTSATTSAAQFIAQADAICARNNTEITAIKAKSTSAAEVIRVVPRRISIERKGIAALEQLNAPASLTRDWQHILGYRRTLADQLAELLTLAKKNNSTSVKPLIASKKRAHVSLAKTATAIGFKDCAKVGRLG